jgi:hypothetical protein
MKLPFKRGDSTKNGLSAAKQGVLNEYGSDF